MRKKAFGVIAAAVATSATMLVSKTMADNTLDYEPVLTVIGDGNTYVANTGVTTSIQVFDNSTPNQAAPVASANFTSTATGLLNTNSTVEGSIENNPSVIDAAASGNPYIGTAYAFSAGYQGTDVTAGVVGAANRVVGYTTVTATSVTNPTIGGTQGPLA